MLKTTKKQHVHNSCIYKPENRRPTVVKNTEIVRKFHHNINKNSDNMYPCDTITNIQ